MADRNSYNENSLKNRDDSQTEARISLRTLLRTAAETAPEILPETAAGIKLTTAAETMTKKAEQTEEK